MNLIVPVLFSGTVASLLATKPNNRGASTALLCYPTFVHRLHRRWNAGDPDFKTYSLLGIAFPMALLVLTTIHRRLYGKQLSLDDQIMDISNSFASMTLCCLGLFLVPVAKHGPILKILQWTPAAAVRLHINAGRLVILGSILHGGGHVYRWTSLAGEHFWSMIIPPSLCWSFYIGDYTPECNDYDTDCSCYDHFRNLTGMAAVACIVVIGITSTNYVRRRYYRIFYLMHVLAAPSALLLVIFHWNKSILYMAPSLLYYAATSAPVVVEQSSCKCRINTYSVKKIDSMDGARVRTCIALTIPSTEQAVKKYASGQYVKLSVPELSLVPHPFTINRVPGRSAQLRIIFRATGKFTHQLAERIQRQQALPQILIDGYYGSQLRGIQVLQHDVVVMVAAGIGITPYLSILGDLKHGAVTKEVILHWICRETELIEYIKSEYFDPLMKGQEENGIKIRLIIHKTGKNSMEATSAIATWFHSVRRNPNDLKVEEGFIDEELNTTPLSVVFEPSKFSAGMNSSVLVNTPIFFTFGIISWMGLYGIMLLFYANNAEEAILYRGWAPLFLVTLSIAVSILGTCVMHQINLEILDTARLHFGSVWSRINESDVTGTSQDLSEPHCESSFPIHTTVTYEERQGRPTMHELLKALDDARCPALFSCGPKGITTELRHVTEEKCLIRIRQCVRGAKIAIYQESFEI